MPSSEAGSESLTAARRRQFIIEVEAQYRVDPAWNILRVLATEDRPTGTGTATTRVYICLAEEVEAEQ